MVSAAPDMTVVGEAGPVAQAIAGLEHALPDVAVLDINLSDGSGLDVCRRITDSHPEVACVMLTSVIDDRALLAAEVAGAAAFALKTVASGDLISTIRSVANGARLLDQAEIRLARQRLVARDDGRLDLLSPQERRIFDLIGAGRSNREIANELFLAEKTVKNYVSNLLAKLGMSRRTEVSALAARIAEREAAWRP